MLLALFLNPKLVTKIKEKQKWKGTKNTPETNTDYFLRLIQEVQNAFIVSSINIFFSYLVSSASSALIELNQFHGSKL